MTQRRELPRPVMRAPTGFHADQARLEIGEEAQHVLALELLAQTHPPMLVDSMHLEQRLCQIDSSCRNLHGDAPSLKWLAYTSTLAPRCRSRKGASIPLIQR